MRVKTNQDKTFADSFIDIPSSKLDTLHKIIDWQVIANALSHIKTDYQPVMLFKALLLGTWHNLSDEKLADSLTRDLVFIGFCGFSLIGHKPDATTLLRFRNKLVKVNLFDKLLILINQMLASKQLKMNNGKHIAMDATLIKSARRPKQIITSQRVDDKTYQANNELSYSDDTDASWTYKSRQYTYGYQTTVSTDEQGLIDKAITHTASSSEMTNFAHCIEQINHTKNTRILYDKGVASQGNRAVLKEKKLKDGIMTKKPKGKPMSHWHKLRNKAISKRRFVVERTFGTIKRTYGMNRTRYLGLEKVASEFNLKAIVYNLVRAVNLYQQLKQKQQDYCVQ